MNDNLGSRPARMSPALIDSIPNILIGADPELFLQDDHLRFHAAVGIIPGTKRQPFLVAGGAVQVDGCAVEFNVDPSDNSKDFIDRINKVYNTLSFMVSKSKPGLNVVVAPTAVFDPDYFRSLPEEAKALGCDPDYDAWSGGRPNPKPKTTEPFRTGAGHIHLGWAEDVNPHDKGHFFDCIQMTKQLDAALFVASHFWDTDTKRRTLYGKMGAFRPKSYGMEYRVLSNRWVRDNSLCRFVFETAQHAWKLMECDVHIYNNMDLNFIMAKEKITREDIINHRAIVADYGFPILDVGNAVSV